MEQAWRRQREQEAVQRKELAGRAGWQDVPPRQRAELLLRSPNGLARRSGTAGAPREAAGGRELRLRHPALHDGRLRALYGIVRPCPELVCLSPQLEFQHLVVRDEQEARQLAAVMPGYRLPLPRTGTAATVAAPPTPDRPTLDLTATKLGRPGAAATP